MVLIIILMGIFYFIVFRPEQKKQKERQAMISGLKKNDEVITSGGIHAVVSHVKESTVVLKIDENVKIEIQKSSIIGLKQKSE